MPPAPLLKLVCQESPYHSFSGPPPSYYSVTSNPGSGVPMKGQGDNVCSTASLILQGTCPIEIISDTTYNTVAARNFSALSVPESLF
jgi:hypothetical protein